MADLHRRHSNHFTETAQAHKSMAAHHEDLAAHFKKSEDSAAEKAHAGLAERHHDCAEKDSVLAAWHHNKMEECEKTILAQMNKVAGDVAPSALEAAVSRAFLKVFGNTVPPSQASAIAPPAPQAVPRFGGREIPVPAAAPEFHKLFSDGEEPLRQ